MPLLPVRVAVVDTGLQRSIGEFDDVWVIDLATGARQTTDRHGHGTQVSGIIAADDDGSATNGLASALGKNLGLQVGGIYGDMFSRVAAVWRAVDDGEADIVNMSYGIVYGPVDAPSQAVVADLYRDMAQRFPDTLFVAAAGNRTIELTELNHAPAGVQAPNFMAVGGTAHCQPTLPWVDADPDWGSAWGPLIDLSAPAQRVPVLPYDPEASILWGSDPLLYDGTSYAAPMVAATAAWMKSLDPDLTGAELKEYLTRYVMPTDELINWRRLMLLLPVSQMLIDRGAPPDVLDLLDTTEPHGTYDEPFEVLNRICDGADLTVSGAGSWTFWPDTSIGASGIHDLGMALSLATDDYDVVFALGQQSGDLQLGVDYAIGSQFEGGFVQTSRQINFPFTSGTVAFGRCAITERNPLDQTPMVVQLSGIASGTYEGFKGATPTSGTFDARWNIPMVVMAGSRVIPMLEHDCEGGLLIR
jgi:hypothetical protein